MRARVRTLIFRARAGSGRARAQVCALVRAWEGRVRLGVGGKENLTPPPTSRRVGLPGVGTGKSRANRARRKRATTAWVVGKGGRAPFLSGGVRPPRIPPHTSQKPREGVPHSAKRLPNPPTTPFPTQDHPLRTPYYRTVARQLQRHNSATKPPRGGVQGVFPPGSCVCADMRERGHAHPLTRTRGTP